MKLKRRKRNGTLITMTPLVDVMLILLVFFMVTSSYLDLNMIPMVDRGEDVQNPTQSQGNVGATLLIRIGSDGQARFRGQPLGVAALAAAMQETPDARVLILPSGFADVQALVGVIELATAAGVTNLRVVRLEGAGG